jgi:hypothetical protein
MNGRYVSSGCRFATAAVSLILAASTAIAQKKASPLKAPEPGYVFPPGGPPGKAIPVELGGYDWTPDVDLIPLDSRLQLEYTGKLGPVLVPLPPYWFGPKGQNPPMPLPRERPGTIAFAATTPPGPVRWTTANANGIGTTTGIVWVGDGRPEIIESRHPFAANQPQQLPALPLTVNGRLEKIEEVDRYQFSVPQDHLISVEVLARRLGVDILLACVIRDSTGKKIVDIVDTTGNDLRTCFFAKANELYTLELHDLDFRGDRSYVYRLDLTPGPLVLATLPTVTAADSTIPIQFIGYGVATGKPVLESISQHVTIPKQSNTPEFVYALKTAYGTSPAVRIPLGDKADQVIVPGSVTTLTSPAAISSHLNGAREARFTLTGKKAETWRLTVECRRFGSSLDPLVTVVDAQGKEIARNDDLPNTTDAGLTFTLPADGVYTVIVADVAGKSGDLQSVFRLTAEQITPDYKLTVPPRLNLEVGGSVDLAVTATRLGGFNEPIRLSVKGLPPGVTVPDTLEIPAKQTSLKIRLTASPELATAAWPIQVIGTAKIGDQPVERPATALIPAPTPPLEPLISDNVWVAVTLPPRINVICVEADGGRKVHRGTTHPAEVAIERLGGFAGPVELQMSAKQSYQRQGITGPDFLVPADVNRTFYPCFMPEWLETTRTSRMELIGVIQVPDPKGRMRYLVTPMAGRITMSIEGAILKAEVNPEEVSLASEKSVDVLVKIQRAAKFNEPVRVEWNIPHVLSDYLAGNGVELDRSQTETRMSLLVKQPLPPGEYEVKVRVTGLQEGKYPVISEATITLISRAAAMK